MKAKLKYIITAIIILVALVVSYVLSLDNKEALTTN